MLKNPNYPIPKKCQHLPTLCRGLCGRCYSKWLRRVNPKYKNRQKRDSRKYYLNNTDLVNFNSTARQKKRSKHQRIIARLRQNYHWTIEEYNKRLRKQHGVCKICRKENQRNTLFHIDHDHSCCPEKSRSCGKCIRGLLCFECNSGLGKFKDNPKLLRRAVHYIEKYRNGRRK